MSNALHKPAARKPFGYVTIIGVIMGLLLSIPSLFATTKGLSQIVTPDLEPEGDFSLSFQIQDKRIANPYQLQGELGGSSSVSRVPTRRMDIRHGDRLVKERALSSFHWVYQLVATPE